MSTILGQPAKSIELRDNAGIRPPLKWAGGKRWLVPELRKIWVQHSHRRLVEPFCGGLAVALGLLPQRALLNDINPHAINFYSQIKEGLVSNIEMLNEEDAYYESRTRFNQLISSGKASTPEAAGLFYYLNRTGFNGLCRFNRQGGFNVPFGRYATINYTHDFTPYKDVFSNWDFSVYDFEKLKVQQSDLIYADPPYDVEFTSYSKEGFNWDDQIRLGEWLASHKGPVIVSNQATQRIVKLYEGLGFRIMILDAPRMISCTGDRTKAQEVLGLKGFQ